MENIAVVAYVINHLALALLFDLFGDVTFEGTP
jgi:hypothetical protein